MMGSRWISAVLVAVLLAAVLSPTSASAQADGAVIGGSVTGEAAALEEITTDLFVANDDGSRGEYLRSVSVVDGRYSYTAEPDCYIVVLIAPEGYWFAVTGGSFRELPTCVAEGETVELPTAVIEPTPSVQTVVGFQPTLVTQTSITMEWTASPDPTVTSYDLFQDGELIAPAVVDTSYEFLALDSATTYRLEIRAVTGDGRASDRRIARVTTLPQFDEVSAAFEVTCSAQGVAEIAATLSNGTDADTIFEVRGDRFADRAPTVAAGENLVLALPTTFTGDGTIAVIAKVGELVIFDDGVPAACGESVIRPAILTMSPDGPTPETAVPFDRPSTELTASVDAPSGGDVVFQHRLTTLEGLLVDDQPATGPSWSPQVPAGYADQILAWTVTVTGSNGATAERTSYLDAVTITPVRPSCDREVDADVAITSHRDNEQADTGTNGTRTGAFVLAGTVTGGGIVTVAIGDESIEAEIIQTADPCVADWSTEVVAAAAGIASVSVTTDQGAAAQISIDIIPPDRADLLVTPAYARTIDIDLGPLILSFDRESGGLVLSGDLTGRLAVGDVVVDDGGIEAAPEGFMRVIDLIELDGSRTVLETHQAALADVFRQVADPVAGPFQAELAAASIDYSFNDTAFSASGKVEVTAAVDLGVDGRAELEIDWITRCGFLGCVVRPQVEYFLIEASASATPSATMRATGVGVVERTFLRADIPGPTFAIGPVPITTALEIAPFVRGSVDAAGDLAISGDVEVGAGYEFARDGTGRGTYRIFDQRGPTLDEAELRSANRIDVGVELEIEIFVADAIGPTVSAKPAVTVTSTLAADREGAVLDWCYGVSLLELAIGGEIEIPVLSVELVELDHRFIEAPGLYREISCGQFVLAGGPCGAEIPIDGGALLAGDPQECELIDRIVERLEGADLGPGSRRGPVRSRNDLRGIARSCIETAGALERAEEFCLDGTVFYSGRDNQQEATSHIASAQRNRAPNSLTYEDRSAPRSGWYYAAGSACGENNQEAQKIYVSNGGASGVAVDCDEYPFFATTAGYRSGAGRQPSLRPISRNSNRSSGRDLGQFANQCPTVKASPPTPYLVVPTGEEVVTKSFWTCAPIQPDEPEPDLNENEFFDSSPVIEVDPSEGGLTEDTRVRVGITDEGQESSAVTVDWELREIGPNGDSTVIGSGSDSVQPNNSLVLPSIDADQARSEIELEVTATDTSGKSSRGLYRYNVEGSDAGDCAEQEDLGQDECLGLLDFYNATGGPDWTNNTSWLDFDAGVCNWFGVTCSLGNVTELRLRNNGLAGPVPPVVGSWTSMQILELDGNQLTSIPPEIGELQVLRVLELGSNALTSIPTEVGNLVQLRLLWVDDNQLSVLPASIGNLDQVFSLNVASNQLTALPTEIEGMTNLRELHGSQNSIAAFPPGIGNITGLQSIWLWNNEISALPDEIGNLTALVRLELRNNNVPTVPNGIGNLTELQSLNLENNGLTVLPPEIGGLGSLRSLRLGGNELASLPREIGQLKELTWLSAGSNNLTSLPTEIGDLDSLETLFLRAGDLTSLPASLGNPPNLDLVALGNNNLTGDITAPMAGLVDSVTRFDIGDSRRVGNNCLTVSDGSVAAWLDSVDRNWDECYVPRGATAD